MSGRNGFAKSVWFNHNNEDDQKILKHISRRNFSKYVKKLILTDIYNKEQKKAEKKQISNIQIETSEVEMMKESVVQKSKHETATEKLERMREKLKQQKPSNPPGPKTFINQPKD